jgi:hypothetical protein
LVPEYSPFSDAMMPEDSNTPRKFFLTTGDKVQYFVLSFERLSSEVVLVVGDCRQAGLSFFHPGEVRGCFVPWHCQLVLCCSPRRLTLSVRPTR